MADESNDYSYLLNVDSENIDETIVGLNKKIEFLKSKIEELKTKEPESLERLHKEIDYEVSIFQCEKIIEKLNLRKKQVVDMHDMYMENFGGLDEIGTRISR